MPEALFDRDVGRRELDTLLASEAFKRSPALRRLLEYLAERSFDGEGDELKEYRIGVEALGKPDSYDPRTDPSVRVQVGRLRSRLAEYYVDEGREDPVRITLPKGAFALTFEEREADLPSGPPETEVAPPPAVSRRGLGFAMAAGVALTLAAAVALWPRQAEGSRKGIERDPQFEALWKPYLDSDLPIVVSLGIPMWLRFEEDAENGASLSGVLRDPSLNDWPSDPTSRDGQRLETWKQTLKPTTIQPWYHYAGVGESVGSFLMGKALAVHGKDASIVRSNVLSWDSLKAANVILIGAPKFTPHLRKVELSHNFRIGDYQVYNLHPGPGELPGYPQDPAPTGERGAALIGRYPSLGGHGWLTVVGSANSSCTWAAVEYLTRPEYVLSLTEGLRQEFGRVPDSFEAVVEADFDNGHPVAVRHVLLRECQPAVALHGEEPSTPRRTP